MHEEGVILRSKPFEERHHIVTLFSQTNGLMKLFVRGSKKQTHALVTPLTRIVFSYSSKSNCLSRLREGRVLDAHLELRKHYELLDFGCQMAKALLLTQLLGKPAPKLYQLFAAYLKQGKYHTSLSSSFLLKILKHEGLLHFHKVCAACGGNLDSIHIDVADAFCPKHAPPHSLHFTEEERAIALHLVISRSIQAIGAIDVPPLLIAKIKELFLRLTDCERGDSNPHGVCLH